MIRHLVLSGGGVFGFSCYGALRECVARHVFDMKNIKTIYATSVGSMLGVMISLKYEWAHLDDFVIKRPWQKVFPFQIPVLCSSIERRGLFDQRVMRDVFRPLFEGRDLSLDITMGEFYDYSGIELHCLSTEVSNYEFKQVDFSHLTHPDWKLLDVVYASSCLPVLFAPLFVEKRCYIDGGVFENYPITAAATAHGLEETLGIFKGDIVGVGGGDLEETSSLFDYLIYLLHAILNQLYNNKKNSNNHTPAMEIQIPLTPTNLYDIYLACTTMEERQRLVKIGQDAAPAAEGGGGLL